MPVYFRPPELLAGLAYLWLGERDLADRQLELAFGKLEARRIESPDNEKLLSSLGVALAALGKRGEALETALRATEVVPLATDPWFAQVHIEDLAWVYTLLGEYDQALEQLEMLLERPSRITIEFLKLDPRWEPLWEQPGFNALQERYGQLPT
ncbi:MAG: tetratricopeptide repeat protein, partial [Acidobacteriota bacterium]